MHDRLPNRSTTGPTTSRAKASWTMCGLLLGTALLVSVTGAAGCATSKSTLWAQTSPSLPPDARPVETVHLGAMSVPSEADARID